MDIATATSAIGRTAAAPAEKPAITSDYSMFLRMLTTQMQNQDPLNPIESADYAVQLATFSGVEQQTQTNQLLQQLLGAIGGTGLSDVAGWVGRDVRSPAPVAHDGTPVTLHVVPVAGAERSVLSVRDARGAVVAREEVTPGARTHAWTATGATGTPLPPGQYSFRLESFVGETPVAESTPETYARVTEVRIGPDGPRVVLRGGVEIAASAVTALREGG
jgi:flagellar basal-body rod modification protein FlgD